MAATEGNTDDILAGLTEDQLDTLLFIDQYRWLQFGVSPTYDEIGREFGIGKMPASGRIGTLRRHGLVSTTPRVRRSIKLTETGKLVISEAARGL